MSQPEFTIGDSVQRIKCRSKRETGRVTAVESATRVTVYWKSVNMNLSTRVRVLKKVNA